MTWVAIGIGVLVLLWKAFVWQKRANFYLKLHKESPDIAETYRRWWANEK